MNGAELGSKYFESFLNSAQTVVPGASSFSSRHLNRTPPGSPLRPRCCSYQANSRLGSAALKKTPPSPVTLPMARLPFFPGSSPGGRGRSAGRLVQVLDLFGNLFAVEFRRDRLVVVLEHLLDGGAAG